MEDNIEWSWLLYRCIPFLPIFFQFFATLLSLSILTQFVLIFNTPLKLSYFRSDVTLEEGMKKNFCNEKTGECTLTYSLYEGSMYLNDMISQNRDQKLRIYGLFEPQGFFLNHPNEIFIPDLFGELFLCFSKNNNPKEILKKLNVKYIFFANAIVQDCQDEYNLKASGLCRAKEEFRLFLENNPDVVLIKSFSVHDVYEIL